MKLDLVEFHDYAGLEYHLVIFVPLTKTSVVMLTYALTLVGLMGLADFKRLRLKFW
jgi:hypothetical protein